MSDPTPPRPDEGMEPAGGRDGTPPPDDPTRSEFLTPTHPYETLEAGAGPPPPPGATPSGRRIWVVLVVIVAVLAAIVGAAVVAADRGGDDIPGAPGGLDASVDLCAAPRCDRITVTANLVWRAPEDGTVTSYEVLRDGARTDRVDAGATTYEMRGLDVDRAYTLGVQAVGPGGTGPATEVSVTTPTPPLGEAQLEGSYKVDMRVRSARNLASFLGIEDPHIGTTSRATWSFTATCGPDQGACPVRWFGRGPIPPQGRGYAGSFPDGTADCSGGARAPVRATIDLVSDSGTASASRWLVKRFHGTFAVEFDCSGGAPASQGIVDVMGRRA